MDIIHSSNVDWNGSVFLKNSSFLFASTVPLGLLGGIAIALRLQWPLTFGLLIGYLWAAVYAKRLMSWQTLFKATFRGIWNMRKVYIVLVLIGLLISIWMMAGVIPALMQVGEQFVNVSNIVWASFLICAVFSMLTGSCFATWGVMAPPLMALTVAHLAPAVAGAIVSGGLVGDRSSPMSTSVMIMSKAARTEHNLSLRQMMRSLFMPFFLTLAAFFWLNQHLLRYRHLGHTFPVVQFDPFWRVMTILTLLPALLVLLLAVLRVPLVQNLAIAIVVGLGFLYLKSGFHGQPLVQVLWAGVHLTSAGHSSSVGGLSQMLMADSLICVAGAFQGITEVSQVIYKLSNEFFLRIRAKSLFVISSYGLCIVFSLLMGSQMLSILMSGNTLYPEFERKGFPQTALLQVIGDTAELFPALVPWNLLGLQAAAVIGFPLLRFAGFEWFVLITILCSLFLVLWKTRSSKFVSMEGVQ